MKDSDLGNSQNSALLSAKENLALSVAITDEAINMVKTGSGWN